MSKPRLPIDLRRVEELAGHGLSQREISLSLGISEDTLQRRKRDSAAFAAALQKGQARGAAEVANKLFEKCMAGDLGAIVWYEKTRCGRTDRLSTEQNLNVKDTTPRIFWDHENQVSSIVAPNGQVMRLGLDIRKI